MTAWSLALVLCALLPQARRVVLVSVDGLRPDAISALGPRGAPTLHRLLAEGAGTLDARTDPRRTYTMPNHLCMLTGRATDGPGGHGFTRNRLAGPLVHVTAGGYVASVFDVVHDHGGRTLFFASKPKFAAIAEGWGHRHGAPDRVGPPDGRAKIDAVVLGDDAEVAARAAAALATEPPELLFLHLAGPDKAGHQAGFSVQAGTHYLEAVAAADAHLGEALAPLLRAGVRRSVVVVTSDHGGVGRGHREWRRPENHRVPLVVWGPGVPAGVDLYAALGRRAPERGDEGGLRNCAVGNLGLGLMGLPPIPGSRFGRSARWVSAGHGAD